MKLEVRRGDLVAQRAGAWVVGVLEAGGPLGGAARAVDRATRGALAALLDSGDFTGRWLELALLHPGHPRTRRVIVVGLGSRAALTPHRVRLAMAAATRRARELGAGTVATVAHGASAGGLDPIVALTATVEGARLGHERLTAFKTEPGPKPLVRITIFERWKPISARQRRAVARGDAIASGTCLARDLANTPGDALPPDALARRARVARDLAGASVQVLGVPQMTRLGMG
ncbi:MAG: hypothetical protein HOP12_09920, partial [Candidatus Eisenbacteria bacterium]|nr:hypothetical protein [Candidatus Eisenbacteria bacterium]